VIATSARRLYSRRIMPILSRYISRGFPHGVCVTEPVNESAPDIFIAPKMPPQICGLRGPGLERRPHAKVPVQRGPDRRDPQRARPCSDELAICTPRFGQRSPWQRLQSCRRPPRESTAVAR
jgi:hypothetical protein